METRDLLLTKDERAKARADYFSGGAVDIEKIDYDEFLCKAQLTKVIAVSFLLVEAQEKAVAQVTEAYKKALVSAEKLGKEE